MELDAAVDYHDYYVTTIDRSLGQPRGNGDIRSAHMIEIARLREVAGETPTVNQLPDLRCTCGQGYDPDCPADAHHGTANSGGTSTGPFITGGTMNPTAEEENEALRAKLFGWRVTAWLAFIAAAIMLAVLIVAHGEPSRQSALPIKGMIVCLTLDDVARIRASGGALP